MRHPNAEKKTLIVREWRVARGTVRFHIIIALYLVAAFLPSLGSLALIVFISLLGIQARLAVAGKQNIKFTQTEILIFATILYMTLAVSISWQYRINFTIFAAEAKLPLLMLAVLAISQLRSFFAFSGGARAISVSLILINGFYFVASGGAFRYLDKLYSGSIGSIYMSIILAVVFLLDQNLIRRIAIVAFIIWLGSSTGLVAFAAGVVTRVACRNGRLSAFQILKALVLSMFLLFLIYIYALEFRGRDLLLLASIDRVQLASAGIKFFIDTITVERFLFGYGVGSELLSIYEYFAIDDNVVHWLQTSRASEGFTGLAFHNDFLRLFANFGAVGSILFWTATLRFVSRPELRAVLISASLLNSTAYINAVFIFIVIAEVLFAMRPAGSERTSHWRSP